LLVLSLALCAACGYSFTAAGRLAGGIPAATVLPFENRSTEPELGAVLAGALREELAVRGALARAGSTVSITGEVSVGAPSPAAPGGVSWRVTLDVRARLLNGQRVVAERSLRREADYPAGLDPLETEGRRALALRKLAADCARELAISLME
jgi:hypothetical protein